MKTLFNQFDLSFTYAKEVSDRIAAEFKSVKIEPKKYKCMQRDVRVVGGELELSENCTTAKLKRIERSLMYKQLTNKELAEAIDAKYPEMNISSETGLASYKRMRRSDIIRMCKTLDVDISVKCY